MPRKPVYLNVRLPRGYELSKQIDLKGLDKALLVFERRRGKR